MNSQIILIYLPKSRKLGNDDYSVKIVTPSSKIVDLTVLG
jgi:hypothetical protein